MAAKCVHARVCAGMDVVPLLYGCWLRGERALSRFPGKFSYVFGTIGGNIASL